MKVGDSVEFKGPFKKFEYTANMKKYIGMVAGGSGITPMLQLIEKILSNPRDNTEVRLIFANRSPDDVLLKDRLDGACVLWLRGCRRPWCLRSACGCSYRFSMYPSSEAYSQYRQHCDTTSPFTNKKDSITNVFSRIR